ncbi:integral component of membrane [Sergentomyia squamirostris]
MQVLPFSAKLMVVFASILLLLVLLLLLHWCFKQVREYRRRAQEPSGSEGNNTCSIYIIESNLNNNSQRRNQTEVPSFDSVVIKSDGLPTYEEALAAQKHYDDAQREKTTQSTC